mgnify:CR=1 FL=1
MLTDREARAQLKIKTVDGCFQSSRFFCASFSLHNCLRR